MSEFILKLPVSKIHTLDITKEYANDKGLISYDNMIRIYKNAPESALLQLRTFGKVTKAGKQRRIVATAHYLSLDNVDEIIEMLTNVKAEMMDNT